MALDTILVCLDGSEASARALPALRRLLLLPSHGARLVRVQGSGRTGPALVLFHVVPTTPGSGTSEMELGQTRHALDQLRLELEQQGRSASVRLARGEPADQILAAAADLRADLVAMATHGRTGASRLVRGSVAESVLRRSTCPVLLVNPHTYLPGEGVDTIARRILVPVDASPESRSILPLAAQVARLGDAELVLAHVEAEAGLGTHQAVFAAARGALGAAAPRVRERVPVGRPAAAILEAIDQERADLVLMATHGREGLERVWLGSVAEAVARACPVPVVVRRVSAPAG